MPGTGTHRYTNEVSDYLTHKKGPESFFSGPFENGELNGKSFCVDRVDD